MSKSELGVYLNDHRAGAAAGSELAKKLATKHAETPHESFFSDLATSIEEDRATLDDLVTSLGVERSAVKEAAGWMVEKLSRLKLSDVVTGSAQLTTLLEEETLALGIEGKLRLWKSLTTASESYPAIAALDLADLISRAEGQLQGLERQRLLAAADALSP